MMTPACSTAFSYPDLRPDIPVSEDILDLSLMFTIFNKHYSNLNNIFHNSNKENSIIETNLMFL